MNVSKIRHGKFRRNNANVLVIPRTEILSTSQTSCKDINTCPTPPDPHIRVVLSEDENPWIGKLIDRLTFEDHVTERHTRSFIRERMSCINGEQFDMSEFIRFKREGRDLEDAAKNQVAGFMNKPDPIRRLTVFGFASPDGNGGHNSGLSENRANAVKGEVESEHKDYLPGDAYDVPIVSVGEDNPINGIANSRSVVIAACRGGTE